MRDQIIQHLVARGVATGEQAEQARALLALGDGGLVSLLCDAGFPEGEVLAAASEVTRLPRAPTDLLHKPRAHEVASLDLAPFRRVGAVPFAVHKGTLCVAFKDPEAALSDAARRLPSHRAFLAASTLIDVAIASLSGEAAPALRPSSTPPRPASTPSQLASTPPRPASTPPQPASTPPRPASSNTPSQPIAAILRSPAADDGWNESGVYRVTAREEVPEPRGATPPRGVAAHAPPLTMDAAELGLVAVEDEEAKTIVVPALSSFEAAAPPAAVPVATPPVAAPPVAAPPVATPAPRADFEDARTVGVAVPEELLRLSSLESPPPTQIDDAPTVLAPALSEASGPGAPSVSPSPFEPSAPQAPSASPSPFAPPEDFGGAGASSEGPGLLPSMMDIFGDPPPTAAEEEPPPLEVPAPAPIHEVPAAAPKPSSPQTGSGAQRRPIDDARQQLVSGIERYETLKVLGRGGMATVYLAKDTASGQQVALKIMEPHLAEDPTFVERFRREMKTSASLTHENVVGVIDCAESDGNLYMAAEFVDAGTLKELLSGLGGRVPGPVVVEVLYQTLLGLAHAHEKNLVHRDLKPANLMLTSTGIVKVGDFGIAKSNTDNTITQTGMLFGTPAYMSPEQAFGRELDGRSDLFSVGTVCYELLTGRNPYNHDNMSTCLILISKASARHIFEVCPSVPPLLEQVLTKMMRQDRNDRYPTAAAAAKALEPLVATLRERYGNLLAQALQDPTGLKEQLARDEAVLEVERAETLLARNPDELKHQAAFRYFRASTLDPTLPAAAEGFARLSQEHHLRFEAAPADDALRELEQALDKKPDSAALLRRGADLCSAKRNLLGAALWMKRYLLLQPNDLHMTRQLAQIVGDDPLAPWRPLPDLEMTPATGAVLGVGSPFGAGGAPVLAEAAHDPFAGIATPIEEPTQSGSWPVVPAFNPAPVEATEELSAPTAIVPGAAEPLRDITGGVRALASRYPRQLKAAGIAAAVLVMGVIVLGGLFGDDDAPTAASTGSAAARTPAPAAGDEAGADKPEQAPREAAPDDEALARIAAEALSDAPEKKEPDWLEERGQKQREHFAAGKKRLSLGDVQGALADFNAALILDAGSDLALDIRLARGKAYAERERYEEARSDLERVTSRLAGSDPRHLEAARLLGELPVVKDAPAKKKKRGKPGFQVGAFEKAYEAQQDDAQPPPAPDRETP